ncbi:hypothetical protein [Paenibacillus sp. NPDC057967]|uniref:hypothetical protein n=1 Tax=Paenibacillus sp. NPDC057967 TaxID=3346293 RepID=UPI0036DA9DBE
MSEGIMGGEIALFKFSAVALSLMLAASCGGELGGNNCMTSTAQCGEIGSERDEVVPSTPSSEEKNEAEDQTEDTPFSNLLPDGKMLAELPQHDVALTVAENRVILRVGERKQAYDWLYMTPGGIKPILSLRDWYGDGTDEISEEDDPLVMETA